MSTLTKILLALLAVETAALVALAVRYRRAKKAAKRRRVEAPNSAYRSEYVQDLEARERWERMDVEALHEVNREEVVRLLEKVRSDGIRSLSSSERDFLDRMAEAAGSRGRRSGRGEASTGRELPDPS